MSPRGLPSAFLLLLLLLPPPLPAGHPEQPQSLGEDVLTHHGHAGAGSTPPRLPPPAASGRSRDSGSGSVLSAAVMRREVLPHDHEEGAGRSLVEDASAKWNPKRVTSKNVVDLDGVWTATDGAERDIKGNTVTGAGDFRMTIAIKQGGRRLEMTKGGKNYWATLTGMGSLNFNDGEVWSRKVDCKFTEWTDFGACGGPCKQSEQQRQREYLYLQENGGAPCVGAILQCQESVYCGADIQTDQANASNTTLDSSVAEEDSAHGDGHDGHGSHDAEGSGKNGDEDAHAHLQTSSSEGEYVEDDSSGDNGSDAAVGNATNKSAAVQRSCTGQWPFLMGALLAQAVSVLRGAA